ncbi:MAG: IS21 family transposase, partial [Planctomycetes bacterium]|nr:IS21 family transposase [Planctomycetota bacterium]
MKVERWHEIHALSDEGLSIRQIARRLHIHRRTARSTLRQTRPLPEKRTKRGSIIDPYRGWLLAKLQQYPKLKASRLFRMLPEQGYSGGYSLVKSCVAELRPRLKPAYFTLAFPPGDCAQVDWGVWKGMDVPGGRRCISFFVMVLCHSRMMYVELSMGEAAEHWLSAHRNAFTAFNGVPRRVMVDNCKTAVITPGAMGRSTVFNPAYLDFAAHYGFKPVACNVGRPNEKGRVEQGVGYVKTSFLAGREPASLVAMAPALTHWLNTVANVRIHGTTKKRPVDLFAETEKDVLLPLPVGPHECAATKSVTANNRFRVTMDTNRYSIPSRYASQRVSTRRYADRIAVYAVGGALIADHPRSYGRHQDVSNPDHERDLLLYTRYSRDRRQLERFLSLGSAADAYLIGLQEKRPDWRGHVTRINALSEAHGRDEVARLLADALHH